MNPRLRFSRIPTIVQVLTWTTHAHATTKKILSLNCVITQIMDNDDDDDAHDDGDDDGDVVVVE